MYITITVRVFKEDEIIYNIPLTLKDDVLESLIYGDEVDEVDVSPTAIRFFKKDVLSRDEMEVLTQSMDQSTMTGCSKVVESATLYNIIEKLQKVIIENIYNAFFTDFSNGLDGEKRSEDMNRYYFDKYYDLIASMNQLIGVLKVTKELNYKVQLESSFS